MHGHNRKKTLAPTSWKQTETACAKANIISVAIFCQTRRHCFSFHLTATSNQNLGSRDKRAEGRTSYQSRFLACPKIVEKQALNSRARKGQLSTPQSLLAKKGLAPPITAPKSETVAVENKVDRVFSVPLLEICKTDVPLVKRIPNSQRSSFATEWGRLLSYAVDTANIGPWTDFFMFPKCICGHQYVEAAV